MDDNGEMDEIRSVILRRSEIGLGFSIMGGAGYDFPPVIYGIEKDSPASRSGVLEAGDIILAINEREVVKLSTKEVLKCLRLSGNVVHIKYKRDPHVVSRVRQFLSSTPHYLEGSGTELSPSCNNVHASSQKGSKGWQSHHHTTVPPPVSPRTKPPGSTATTTATHTITTDRQQKELPNPNHISSFSEDLFINHSHQLQHQNQSSIKSFHQNNPFANNIERNGGRKNFETFVMTGNEILNLTRTDANDSYRSPTKTSSKLTPMPQNVTEITATSTTTAHITTIEQHPMNLDKGGKSSLSIEEDSPPLPSPPSNSEKIVDEKSDNVLPPPPPLCEGIDRENDSLSNNVGNNDNGVVVCNKNSNINHAGNGIINSSNLNNFNNNNNNEVNNEDTSISSSVMSDSEEVLQDDDDDDGDDQELLIGDKNRIVLKVEANSKQQQYRVKGTSNGPNCSASDTNISGIATAEKERYPEYLLLGKSSPNEEDHDPNSASDSCNALEGNKRVHKREKGSHGIPTKISEVNESDDSESEEDIEQDLDESSEMGLVSGRMTNGSGGDSDNSDVESMRIAPVVKAVDLPSAERLAKRLFSLDGFRVTDVWRQLCKCNDFSRAVATEYLKFFDFVDQPLDVSLRKFLSICPLRGETSERERVLEHFSTRYVECNPNVLGSVDSCHTLTCALMLLNTDIYSDVKARRHMSCTDFIKNLNGLNDGKDFSKELLKQLYLSIKSKPLVSPSDAEEEDDSNGEVLPVDTPVSVNTVEIKRGYLMRKSTFEAGGKKSPLGKRSWKMFFCRLRELVLILSHDETSKSSASKQNTQPIKIHHCFAMVASDYQKRSHVFKLILADRSQFLFQSSDSREMHSWIDVLNWSAALHSSPALEAPVSSSRRFQRPLLPTSVTRLNSRDQLASHQTTLSKFEDDINELNQMINNSSKSHISHHKKEIKERLAFYQFEIRRYKAYVDELEKRTTDHESERNGTAEELVELQVLPNPSVISEEVDENNLS